MQDRSADLRKTILHSVVCPALSQIHHCAHERCHSKKTLPASQRRSFNSRPAIVSRLHSIESSWDKLEALTTHPICSATFWFPNKHPLCKLHGKYGGHKGPRVIMNCWVLLEWSMSSMLSRERSYDLKFKKPLIRVSQQKIRRSLSCWAPFFFLEC